MLTKKQFDFLFTELCKRFPENKTELVYETPFQLAVAVILSAQTTDKQVNKATKKFFDHIKTSSDLIQRGFDNFKNAIRSIGLYNSKAKNIRELSHLIEKNGLPNSKEELKKLPGIGEKTARVIMHVLYGAETIAVDTHVHRVCNRLGIVTTNRPEQTSKIIDSTIPDRFKKIAHHTLILFGRYHCKAKKPLCGQCPFTSFCLFYKKIS